MLTRRAAELWTTCSLCSSWLLTPASRLLQLSSRLPTKACTWVLVASDVSDCLIALSRRKWKKQDRLSAATWLVMVSWPSSRTPRSLTTDENGTVVFCNFSVWTVTLSSCWRVPSQMILLSSPRLASGDCWPSSYGSAFLVLCYDLSVIWWLLRHVCNQIIRSIRAANSVLYVIRLAAKV